MLGNHTNNIQVLCTLLFYRYIILIIIVIVMSPKSKNRSDALKFFAKNAFTIYLDKEFTACSLDK